jgi:hypothetical protein
MEDTMKRKALFVPLACLLTIVWIACSISLAGPPKHAFKPCPPKHAKKVKLEVLNPRGEVATDPPIGLFAPRVEDLNGKTIVLISTTTAAQWFFSDFEELLVQVYPEVTVIQAVASQPYFPEQDGTEPLADVISQCDTWVSGVQDMGAEEEDWAVTREQSGKPGVEVVVERLLYARERRAEANGMPTLRIATVPDLSWLEGKDGEAEMGPVVAEVFDSILEAIISPLTDAEINPEPRVVDYSPITFTGGSYSVAYEKFQKYFTDNEMGDGISLTPPTREAVDWMLTGTSRSPSEELGRMAPGYGMATIEKIAINAVMAGAKPEYLPVIIAAIEVEADENMRFYHLINAAASCVPVIWVSGPIAQELGMRAGMLHLGTGNRPNNTIGRAVSLCNLNIGWAVPSTDSGRTGRPEGYCNYVIAENMEYSPWTTYAERQGYGPEESIVTINEVMRVNRMGPSTLGGLVNLVQENGIPGGMMFNNQRWVLTIYAGLALKLAKAGFTAESLQQYIYDNVTVMAHPDDLAILVSGGLGGYSCLFWGLNSSSEHFEPDAIPFISKVIHGATLTEAGR